MDQQKLFTHLKDLGACNHCCLRYLGGKGNDYLDVNSALEQKGISLPQNDDEHSKRIKPNTCTVCLGVFDINLLDRISEGLKNHPDVDKYQCQKVTCAITVPIVLHIRQLLVWVDLLSTFPDSFKKDEIPDNSLKDAFKVVVNHRVTKATRKYSDANGILVSINITFPNEEEVLQNLARIKPSVFQERKQFKKYKDFITRVAFEKHFTPSTIDFRKLHANYQLEVPETGVQLGEISIKGPMVYVAGRYIKHSRRLSQTPWVLDRKRVLENSVQEFITRELAPFFEVPEETLNFMASGREDVDVRCLGKGRPFVVEVPDAKYTDFFYDNVIEIERKIRESGQIEVQNLQVVSRESTSHLKTGEEDKRKHYRALCLMERPVTDEDIARINKPEGFMVTQPTPLRVLHRRPLHDRPRMVYEMQAEKCTDNEKALVISVTTQAGTYVKELVHGELGRTSPSVRSMLGENIDIVALDVTAVDLNWPREVREYKQ